MHILLTNTRIKNKDNYHLLSKTILILVLVHLTFLILSFCFLFIVVELFAIFFINLGTIYAFFAWLMWDLKVTVIFTVFVGFVYKTVVLSFFYIVIFSRAFYLSIIFVFDIFNYSIFFFIFPIIPFKEQKKKTRLAHIEDNIITIIVINPNNYLLWLTGNDPAS